MGPLVGAGAPTQRWGAPVSVSISLWLPARDVTLFWDVDCWAVRTTLPHIQFSLTGRMQSKPNAFFFKIVLNEVHAFEGSEQLL